MPFANRLLRAALLVGLTAVLLVAFVVAIASLASVQESDQLTTDVAAEASDEPSPDPASPTPSPGGLSLNSAGIGSIDCRRTSASGASFQVILGSVEPDPDSLVVAVALRTEDEVAHPRTVQFSITAVTEVVFTDVPDSSNPSFVTCSITAIQRGRQVLITGQ